MAVSTAPVVESSPLMRGESSLIGRVVRPALAAFALAVSFGPADVAHGRGSGGENLTPAASSQARPPAVVPDVSFEPSSPEMVDAMLRIADLKRGDVVYDLGCGDGRIVIAAARKYGARGVGIDVDPQRIHEATENARRAGVSDKVRFIEASFFAADISEATVVTLYLGDDVNLRLQPKLIRELKPGARIVSHHFDMGDWKPKRVRTVGDTRLYLWTIPGK
jgi:SAM-dependent methyltransferase